MKPRSRAFLAGILLVLLYAGVEWAGQGYSSLVYQTMVSRLTAGRLFMLVLFVFYLGMVVMAILAIGRWLAELGSEIILACRRRAKKDRETAWQPTLDNSLIIDSPKLQRPVTRMAEACFSVVVWLYFFQLLQSLWATFFWLLGLDRVYNLALPEEAVAGTLETMMLLFYTALVSFGVLFAWAQWNYWRYGRLERRRPRPQVEVEEVAAAFSLTVAAVQQAQLAQLAYIEPIDTNYFMFREQALPDKVTGSAKGEQ